PRGKKYNVCIVLYRLPQRDANRRPPPAAACCTAVRRGLPITAVSGARVPCRGGFPPGRIFGIAFLPKVCYHIVRGSPPFRGFSSYAAAALPARAFGFDDCDAVA